MGGFGTALLQFDWPDKVASFVGIAATSTVGWWTLQYGSDFRGPFDANRFLTSMSFGGKASSPQNLVPNICETPMVATSLPPTVRTDMVITGLMIAGDFLSFASFLASAPHLTPQLEFGGNIVGILGLLAYPFIFSFREKISASASVFPGLVSVFLTPRCSRHSVRFGRSRRGHAFAVCIAAWVSGLIALIWLAATYHFYKEF
ncbi:hypothetical protein DFJ73DRAFT_768573 [Zopfochytrium polystomum]|nr:hypothetical protein DFJ73DRAFT_768573 [Zopfochytrium polystomum]